MNSPTTVETPLADLASRPTVVVTGCRRSILVGCVTGDVWRVGMPDGTVERVREGDGKPVSVLLDKPGVVGTVGPDGTRLQLGDRAVMLNRDDVLAIEPVEGRDDAVRVVCADGVVLLAAFSSRSWALVDCRRPSVVVANTGIAIDAGAAGVLDVDASRLRALAGQRHVSGRVVALTTGPAGAFLHSTGGSLVRLSPPAPDAGSRITIVADEDSGSLGRRAGLSGWSGGVTAGAGLIVRVHPAGRAFEWAAESTWRACRVALCCGDTVVSWDTAGSAEPRMDELGSAATGVVRIGDGFGTVHADGTVRSVGAGATTVLGCTRHPLLGTLSGDGWTVGVSLGGEVVDLGRRPA